MVKRAARFLVLVYRMPAKPTAARVAVWRQLKKVGAIYLQQSVCAFPDNAVVRRDLQSVLKRINDSFGEYHLLPMRQLSRDEQLKLVTQFREQTAKHYVEIIENCEVNFAKEIEFETFRKNFTYEEAEEIRTEFEKICAWFDRVKLRDWFDAPNRDQAHEWIQRCETLLEEFEARVYVEQEKASTGSAGGTIRQRRRPRSNGPNRSKRDATKVVSLSSLTG